MGCNEANKGIHHIIKIVAFQFTNRVCTILLESDTAIGDNANIALRIDCSLNKLDELAENDTEKVMISRLSADSSGRETQKGLVQ